MATPMATPTNRRLPWLSMCAAGIASGVTNFRRSEGTCMSPQVRRAATSKRDRGTSQEDVLPLSSLMLTVTAASTSSVSSRITVPIDDADPPLNPSGTRTCMPPHTSVFRRMGSNATQGPIPGTPVICNDTRETNSQGGTACWAANPSPDTSSRAIFASPRDVPMAGASPGDDGGAALRNRNR